MVNLIPAERKDDETPFCFRTIRLLWEILLIREFYSLRVFDDGSAERHKRKVLVVWCKTCGDVMDSK